MKESQSPLVAINCLVYNHEPYLRDCFDGFVMQQTTFSFVAIVHDDASTDGSAAIIREYTEKYPHIFHPIYEEENQFSKPDGSLAKIMNQATDDTGAKYVAMCEGDDYWTDPLKLQKQIEILEANESLMLCCTACSVVDKNKKIIEEKRSMPVVLENREGIYDLRDFFAQAHQYPTASVVYRRKYTQELRKKTEIMRNPFMGDWTLWIALLCFGNCYYLDQITTAYRINPTSVTNTNSKKRELGLAKENFRLIPAVASIIPDQYSDVRKNLLNDTAWMWYRLAVTYKKNNKLLRMCYCLLRCILKNPSFIYKQRKRK